MIADKTGNLLVKGIRIDAASGKGIVQDPFDLAVCDNGAGKGPPELELVSQIRQRCFHLCFPDGVGKEPKNNNGIQMILFPAGTAQTFIDDVSRNGFAV